MPATLLALDLSTAHGSIAVVRGDDVLFRSTFQSERSHNAQVFAPLREALAAAGDQLTGIVIGNGPGSYTGVRIAIAAAQGIALSRNVWSVGCPSLAGPGLPASIELKDVTVRPMGDNVCFHGFPVWPGTEQE